MKGLVETDKEYTVWLKGLKSKVRSVQLKAMVKVNTELLNFYWELGKDIAEKQKNAKWGDRILSKLSMDLMSEFPNMKGFSKRNLELVCKWFLFYSDTDTIAKQAVSQLENQKVQELVTQIPWGHNITISTKCKSIDEALFYVNSIIKNGWSRSVLTHQIENGLYASKGQSISNFDFTLPSAQSDLAKETLKSPYVFDFLNLQEKHDERELEYSVKDINKPIGVSEYVIAKKLPKELKLTLPTVEEIKAELK